MVSPQSREPGKRPHKQTSPITTYCSLPKVFFLQKRKSGAGLRQLCKESPFL